MKAKYEVGPWMINGDTEIRSCEKAVNQWVAETHWPYSRRGTKITPKERANARLIAAAPELLAALRAILLIYEYEQVEGSKVVGLALDRASVVIAKAEGKPPADKEAK